MGLDTLLVDGKVATYASRLKSTYNAIKCAPFKYKLGVGITVLIGGWYSLIGIANAIQGDFAGLFFAGFGAVSFGATGDILRSAYNKYSKL